jgi:hypothetical protein
MNHGEHGGKGTSWPLFSPTRGIGQPVDRWNDYGDTGQPVGRWNAGGPLDRAS